MNRDVIVIGASAGGVEVLLTLVSELPANLPAAIFVVLHTSPEVPSVLPELMSMRGRLPAIHAVHDDKIELGHIYVAPPDNHLLLRPGRMEVVRGARENGHRPAADALFRTASRSYGPRVVGVVLSGYQSCGTAGMMSIKARGGIAVVQSPDSAAAPDMPQSVLDRVDVDYVVHPLELPGLLVQLADSPAPPSSPEVSDVMRQIEGSQLGAPVEIVCPLCQGVLTEAKAGGFEDFRCHVGHAFTLDSLVREQSEDLERTLWAAVRALEESSALSQRLAAHASDDRLRARFSEKARTQMQQADTIRDLLLRAPMLTPPDANRV